MTRQSLDKLVTGIVDYAGLFPPAGLDMKTVVQNYAEYLSSEHNWMLARLIVPAARLDKFVEAAAGLLPQSDNAEPWKISALVPQFEADGEAFIDAISRIRKFNERHSLASNGLAIVDVIETRLPSNLSAFADELPENIAAFLELALDDGLEDSISSIASLSDEPKSSRFFAKIRTGGVEPAMIPPATDVARFIATCARYSLPFKATAGLHHPLRGSYRLTYEADSDQGTMFGYLNVFAAACFAFSSRREPSFLEAVLDASGSQLAFDEQGLSFQGQTVATEQVEQIRRDFAISFGSCSFDEPTSELADLWSQRANT